MSDSLLESKYNILKLRIMNIIEEHADALAKGQFLHNQLQEAKEKIVQLEEKLRKSHVQEKEPTVTVVNE